MPHSSILPQVDQENIRNLVTVLSVQTKFVVAISCFGEKVWIRISANVYNSKEDFIKLRDRFAEYFQLSIQ